MDIRSYLDSTYLKTAEQAGLTEAENLEVVKRYVSEAITERFKLIMVRPNMVKIAREMIVAARSTLLVGTVIDFPEGTSDADAKLKEASQAIADGADDLDFVCNYTAYIKSDLETVRDEVLRGTTLAIENMKTVKWIIEVAALEPEQIIKLSSLIKNCVVSNFKEDVYEHVYVKSSTGFYNPADGRPNGATLPSIKMMLDNASPLQIKAAGGVRNYEEALEMIRLGVKRIGTSSARAIADGAGNAGGY